MMRSGLVVTLLIAGILPSAGGAFVVPSPGAGIAQQPACRSPFIGRAPMVQGRRTVAPPVALHGSGSDDKDGDGEGSGGRSPSPRPRGDEAERRYREMLEKQEADGEPPAPVERSPLNRFFDAAEIAFSYSVQFLSWVISLGIVLNLCGYGYTFDLENGIQIDTIANMRERRQFEYAATKMQETRPRSSLPE